MPGIKDLKPKYGGQFKQGYYKPSYPDKYKTNTKQIIYRSSWEFKLCKWLDLTPEVIEWASEPVSIKYFYTLDNKVHTYYPDFYFAYKKPDGRIIKYIVDTNMEVGQTINAIKGVLDWHYVRNDGASFSILEGQRWFFIIGTVIILAVIAVIIAKKMIIL